jgi:hypothetical protein
LIRLIDVSDPQSALAAGLLLQVATSSAFSEVDKSMTENGAARVISAKRDVW